MLQNSHSNRLRLYLCIYGLGFGSSLLFSFGLIVYARTHDRIALSALGVALLVALLYAVARRLREFSLHRHIPGPAPSFCLGNLAHLLAHEHGARDRALVELHRRYGPVLRLHSAWGGAPFVSLSIVSHNLRRKDLDSNRTADRTVLPNSLMGLPMGERHQAHRQKLDPYFIRQAVLRGLPRVDTVSSCFIEAWSAGGNRYDDLKADIHHWSASGLGSFLCGEDWIFDRDLSDYLAAIAVLEEVISFRAFHPIFVRWLFPRQSARSRAAYRYLYDFFAASMARRAKRRAEERDTPSEVDDVLGLLTRLRREAGAGDGALSDVDCIEEMISIVAGGTDAMSYTVSQALVLLSQNPRVQEEARGYIDAASAESSDEADAFVPFVLNIVHETMRLFPAVPFSSKVSRKRPVVEQGLAIPAGTNLMWMKTAVGANGAVFDAPARFVPDRFSTGRAGARPSESISRALPFGAGPRHCIGHRLAEIMCARFLTQILQRFELVAVDNVDVEFFATVSVVPSAVPVRLVPLCPASRTTPCVPGSTASKCAVK